MAKKRFALVGTGLRAIHFTTPLVQRFGADAELVGLCDLSATRLAFHQRLLTRLGHPAVPAYPASEFARMLQEKRPDRVIVTTKDSTHHEYIIRALREGCDVITEKPMTIDADKCRAIFAAVEQTGRRVQVAFNYRWSPHRTKVRELVAAGTIGRVVSINLEYLLNTSHGADYYRRWHASMAESGGLLVHKSTHHFDLVNWWIDAIPEQVFALGRLDFYGRDNAIARGERSRTLYPRYTGEAAAADDPFALDLRQDETLRGLYHEAEKETGYLRDQNVFRPGIDIYDNMAALVRYRTGALLTYSLLSFSAREGMRVTLNGERGRLEYAEFVPAHILPSQRETLPPSAADDAYETIRVYPHFKASYDVPVARLEGGHDGADPLLAEQIFSAHPPADAFNRKAGHEQGAASILIGIAANQSIASGRPVDIASLFPLRPGTTRLSELV
jgi:predicted dehydrogenase